MPIFEWASHRTMPLTGKDIVVLAVRSSGWCVITTEEYKLLNEQLPGNFPNPEVNEALNHLWKAGLVMQDGLPHLSSIYHPASYPTAVLLKLTGTCNIECEYCYDYDSKRFKAQQTFEVIQKTLRNILNNQEQFSLAFHGGEPLLRFSLMKEIVEWLKPYHTRIGFSVQTNGTRFTPEILDFLEKYEFSVGLSLDGLDEKSNALRKTYHGLTPLQAIKSLMKERPDFVRDRCGFLAVASRTSAPGLSDFSLWLQDFGVKGLSITFLDLVGRGQHLIDERLSPNEAIAVYRNLIELIRRGDIHELAIRNLLGRMHNLFTLQSRDLCYRGPCGAAGDFLVLDAEGKKRTCDCIYHPYFELDSTDNLENAGAHKARNAILERHEWLREKGPTCATCPLFGPCGGTCVAKAIAQHGSVWDVDPVECALSQYIYPELFQEFVSSQKPLFEYYSFHENKPFEFNFVT